MCGIAGVVDFAGRPVAEAALHGACAALRHRGPDDAGVWVHPAGGAVGLAATRLAVLDPTLAAHQPFLSRDGRFVLVYNGELYNYRALRRELEGAGDTFRTEGDTEVVLSACARWGVEALGRFNGMWGLGFFDTVARTGFLARDRFGIKPLFFARCADRLSFASELGGLAALGIADDTIDPEALVQHLLFGFIAHPATIYRGARRLPPGHLLRFDSQGAQEPQRWFDATAVPAEEGTGEDGATRTRLRRAIADAVAVRRVADVPLGAFLSGGLDSSIVALHLAEAVGRPIQTFSVGYHAERSYDETPFARMVARQLGTDHHEVMLGEREVLEAIPRILDHLAEPVGDSSIVPTALLSEVARRRVTVALSGDGGDELFGGYWRYLGHDALRAYERIPGWLRRGVVEPLLGRWAATRASGLGNRVRQFRKLVRAAAADPPARHVAWSRILSPEGEGLVANGALLQSVIDMALSRAREATGALARRDPLTRILAFDLQHGLPADMLHKVDLASMMHSLEVRVPLLDPRVVRAAFALPAGCKIDRGQRKAVLRNAYRGRLPDEVLDRPKQGFEVPVGEYLRGPMRAMFHDTVTRAAVESFGILSFDAVTQLYQDHAARRADHADVLFALLSLCWWRGRGAGGAAG